MSIVEVKERTISSSSTLLDALKLMDLIDRKLLLLLKDNKFEGLLSIGDIQRAILQNLPLTTSIKEVIRKSIKIGTSETSIEDIKKTIFEHKMEFYPIISDNNDVVKVYFWEDFFETKKPQIKKKISVPVVIMAGGFGTRLKPLTNVLPKPLIPIGEKTMIEEIIDRFSVNGCNDFFISVNYKAEFIEYYLNNIKLDKNIIFFKEDNPRGTAGSLSLLKEKVKETFFVSNCDILIEQDYTEILDFHKSQNNELTIVAALKNYHIPYGTLEIGSGGDLLDIKEKPDFSVWVNTGMYILEPHLLNEIPENEEIYHITYLIEKLKKERRKVGVFPVSEGSWLDTGEWDEYNKTVAKLSKK